MMFANQNNLIDQFKIINVHPITMSESMAYYLMIVTETGLRIFISLTDSDRSFNYNYNL